VIRRRSSRTARRASIGFLLALLLVPLALAAHTHPGSITSGSCATCIVAHHTPTLAASVSAVVATAVQCVPLATRPAGVPAWTEAVAPSGRGPPALTLS
jgi:hypothetical protein